MIEVNEILQTMQMIHEQHFDIRTITMGISLLSCKKNTDRETAEAVYEKVTRLAKNLVPVGEALEMELGIPIVNKRISVTPVSMISDTNPVLIAKALDEAAFRRNSRRPSPLPQSPRPKRILPPRRGSAQKR